MKNKKESKKKPAIILELSNADGIHFIELHQIESVEACGSQACIHTLPDSGHKPKLLFSKNLKKIEELLPATQFLRTHRSRLVNMQYVISCLRDNDGKHFFMMKSKNEVPIAVRELAAAKDALHRFKTNVH